MRKFFERKARRAGCTDHSARRSGLELVELWFQLVERGAEVCKPLFFLRDDRRRSALDETRIGELGIGFGDLGFEAGDLLPYALGFCRGIDFEVQHYAMGSDYRYRRICSGKVADDAQLRRSH